MTNGWIVAVCLVATSPVRRSCVPLLASHPVLLRVSKIFKAVLPKLIQCFVRDNLFIYFTKKFTNKVAKLIYLNHNSRRNRF